MCCVFRVLISVLCVSSPIILHLNQNSCFKSREPRRDPSNLRLFEHISVESNA